jgi:tetratricopeptide (TPR) repeat protein
MSLRTHLLKFPLPVILFLMPLIFNGQNPLSEEIAKVNEDSLIQILPDLKDTEYINALNKISFGIFSEYPDSSLTFSKEALLLSEERNYKKGIADAYFNIGFRYFMIDSLKTAIVYYLKALRIYEDLPPSVELGVLLEVFRSLNLYAGRLDESINNAKKAASVFKQLENYRYEIVAVNSIGYCYWYDDSESDRWDSAYYYHLRALELLEKHPDNFLFSRVYHSLSAIAIMWGNRDDDRSTHYKKVIEWSNKALYYYNLADPDDIVSRFRYLPFIYFHLSVGLKYASSQDSIDQGTEYTYDLIKLGESNDTADPNILLHAYYVLALAKYRSGDYISSIDLNKKAIEKASEKLKSFPIKLYQKIDPFSLIDFEYEYRIAVGRWPNNLLYLSYLKMGDYKNALKYFTLKVEADKEIYMEDNKALIAMLEAESEAEKIEKQIAFLEVEKETSELRAAQSRNLSIGIAILFFIIILLGILFSRQNRLRNEHKSTLLEQKLLRLQMNPHFIYNALSNIMHAIEEHHNNIALEYLAKFSKLLRGTLESSREDYILLEEEIKGIENYFELQQLRFEDKFDYAIDIDGDIDLEKAIIPPLLLQPFIENAIEHGISHKETKGMIKVRFLFSNKMIVCEIEDDGVGRDKAWETKYQKKEHKSLAIDIIRDRIEVINRKLRHRISLNIIDLKSEKNQALGTLVRLNLPYLLD